MFVILAIVMSFVAVQAVQAITLEGTVTAITHNTITLDSGEIVSSLGPKAYWRSVGMTYPKVGDILCIDAYDGQNGYIAVTVCYGYCDSPVQCIQLRDPNTLIPFWIAFQITDATELSATAGDGICDCCPDCPNCTCPDCTDCQKTRQRKRGQTTTLSLTNETGDMHCRCICDDVLQDCHCFCGDGPTGNDD